MDNRYPRADYSRRVFATPVKQSPSIFFGAGAAAAIVWKWQKKSVSLSLFLSWVAVAVVVQDCL